MQKILLAQAKEGMVLAREIETPEGRILCGKDTELSESLLTRLARMDIVSIYVKGHPVEDPEEKPLMEQLADIEERFSRVNDIAPLHYIKTRLLQQLAHSQKDADGGHPSPDKQATKRPEADSP